MPIYEYKCNACDHRLEKLQRISDDPLKDCPECSAPELTKLISAAGFRLTGTGWYETDFKNKSGTAKSSTEKAAPSSNSSSD
ncbi:FmdB family zinc ribbon protein [Aliikangiella maris]|uniref:Zinc ribbon domain-containing protein n=2 Tax=Aliikangiella maris TaxID=3162458 RepID=A0ABV3MN10_9GAMM